VQKLHKSAKIAYCINGYRLDLFRLVTPRFFPEGLQGIATLAFFREYYGPSAKIQHYCQVPAPLADGDLIKGTQSACIF
jgi:hypothetical protein